MANVNLNVSIHDWIKWGSSDKVWDNYKMNLTNKYCNYQRTETTYAKLLTTNNVGSSVWREDVEIQLIDDFLPKFYDLTVATIVIGTEMYNIIKVQRQHCTLIECLKAYLTEALVVLENENSMGGKSLTTTTPH